MILSSLAFFDLINVSAWEVEDEINKAQRRKRKPRPETFVIDYLDPTKGDKPRRRK